MGRAAVLTPLHADLALSDVQEQEFARLNLTLCPPVVDPLRGCRWWIVEGDLLPVWRFGEMPRTFRTIKELITFADAKRSRRTIPPRIRP